MAAAAAMCAVCVHRDGRVTDARALCTIDGRHIEIHAYEAAVGRRLGVPHDSPDAGRWGCPLGRHPDARGIVRLNGVEWYGLPWPVRVILRVGIVRRSLGLPPLTGREQPHDGCGCVRALKVIWMRLTQRRRGA